MSATPLPLERAADFLEQYAAFIRREVMSVDIECHPYLPEMEEVASEIRAASLSPPINPGEKKMSEANKLGASPLFTVLDLTLTKEELEYVAAFLTDDAERDDDAVRLLLGDGHSGYGLYAAHPEYPGEGAILVKSLPVSAPRCAALACANRIGILSADVATGAA